MYQPTEEQITDYLKVTGSNPRQLAAQVLSKEANVRRLFEREMELRRRIRELV